MIGQIFYTFIVVYIYTPVCIGSIYNYYIVSYRIYIYYSTFRTKVVQQSISFYKSKLSCIMFSVCGQLQILSVSILTTIY